MSDAIEVKLRADDKQFRETMASAKSSAGDFAGKAARVGGTVNALGAAFSSVRGPAGAATAAVGQLAGSLAIGGPLALAIAAAGVGVNLLITRFSRLKEEQARAFDSLVKSAGEYSRAISGLVDKINMLQEIDEPALVRAREKALAERRALDELKVKQLEALFPKTDPKLAKWIGEEAAKSVAAGEGLRQFETLRAKAAVQEGIVASADLELELTRSLIELDEKRKAEAKAIREEKEKEAAHDKAAVDAAKKRAEATAEELRLRQAYAIKLATEQGSGAVSAIADTGVDLEQKRKADAQDRKFEFEQVEAREKLAEEIRRREMQAIKDEIALREQHKFLQNDEYRMLLRMVSEKETDHDREMRAIEEESEARLKAIEAEIEGRRVMRELADSMLQQTMQTYTQVLDIVGTATGQMLVARVMGHKEAVAEMRREELRMIGEALASSMQAMGTEFIYKGVGLIIEGAASENAGMVAGGVALAALGSSGIVAGSAIKGGLAYASANRKKKDDSTPTTFRTSSSGAGGAVGVSSSSTTQVVYNFYGPAFGLGSDDTARVIGRLAGRARVLEGGRP